MKSVTKFVPADGLVEKLVKIHFSQARLIEVTELKGGAFNRAFLITADGIDGGKAVLKLGPKEGTRILTYEKDIMKTEVAVYNALKDKDVPLPRILCADFTRKNAPCDYFFMEYVSGRPWTKTIGKVSASNKAKLMRSLGQINAEINSVEGQWFGYIKEDENFRFSTWYDAFSSMVGNILKDGQMRSCKLPYGQIEAAVVKNKEILNEVTSPKLVDFDLWAGNIFLENRDGEFEISGIVDFERAFYGDAYADFAASVMVYKDVRNQADFIKGYESVRGSSLTFGAHEKVRMNLYKLYLNTIMFVETYRYNRLYAKLIERYCITNIKKLLKQIQ